MARNPRLHTDVFALRAPRFPFAPRLTVVRGVHLVHSEIGYLQLLNCGRLLAVWSARGFYDVEFYFDLNYVQGVCQYFREC